MRKQEKKEMKQKEIKLQGVARLPYFDYEGTEQYSLKLELTEESYEYIGQVCESLGIPEPSINDEMEVRLKTNYKVPVFWQGVDMYDEDKTYSNRYFICDGDKVTVIAQLKEYEYMRKHGSTLYLKGAKVHEINEEEHNKTYEGHEVTLADFEDDIAF